MDRFVWLPFVLAFLRFLGVTGLAMLLLTPLLKQVKEEVKKPQVVLLQDRSQSVTSDASEQATAYQTDFDALRQSLSETYDVSAYQFGDEIKELDRKSVV